MKPRHFRIDKSDGGNNACGNCGHMDLGLRCGEHHWYVGLGDNFLWGICNDWTKEKGIKDGR